MHWEKFQILKQHKWASEQVNKNVERAINRRHEQDEKFTMKDVGGVTKA